MKNTDRKYLFISVMFLVCSIVVTCLYIGNGYKMTEPSVLNSTVKELTASYRLRQIVATVIMYAVGFFCVYPFFSNIGKEWSYLFAMPIGNALWGVVSAFVLFTGIPYDRYIILALTFLIVLFLFLKFRQNYRRVEWIKIFAGHITVVSISIMASSGVFAKFTSSDSYYFVMQYGELIAKQGRLSSDVVGVYMTWTGIAPALTSAFAAMWGFETIYAIHYMLIFSMYGFIMLLVYRCALVYYSKKVSMLLSVAALVTAGIVPGVSYLSFWIINNTYFMVYIVFLMMLPVISNERLDHKIICIMLPMVVWLTLCRPETALVMCFFIICISSIKVSKKQIIVLYSAVCIPQLLFFGKLIYEYFAGARQATEKMLTTETAAVLVLALIGTAVYVTFYSTNWICFIRERLKLFVFGGLIISCLVLGALNIEKLLTNVRVTIFNVSDWYWGYVPYAIAVMEILKSYYKCRKRYYDLIAWGFILCNFVVCMGRPHPLRLGIGDSFNRICMSIIPLYAVTTVLTFVEYLGLEKEGK